MNKKMSKLSTVLILMMLASTFFSFLNVVPAQGIEYIDFTLPYSIQDSGSGTPSNIKHYRLTAPYTGEGQPYNNTYNHQWVMFVNASYIDIDFQSFKIDVQNSGVDTIYFGYGNPSGYIYNVTLRNLYIYSEYSSVDGVFIDTNSFESATLRNCTFEFGNQYGRGFVNGDEHNNLTVDGFRFTTFSNGRYVSPLAMGWGNNTLIQNVYIDTSQTMGYYSSFDMQQTSYGVTFKNSVIIADGSAEYVFKTRNLFNMLVENVTFRGGGAQISDSTGYSGNYTIRGCSFVGAGTPIELSPKTGNYYCRVYNNFFNCSGYPLLSVGVGSWTLSIPLEAGTRPIVGGNLIGGNYWGKSNGSGFSDTGTDANTDGFIDSSFVYTFAGSATDSYPYSASYVPTPTPTPFIPTPSPIYHYLPYFSMDYYFHATAITVNNVSGYFASEIRPNVETNITTTGGTNESTVTYGLRIYLVQNRTTVELTNGVPIATATAADTAGIQHLIGTWFISEHNLQFGKDALKFNIYVSFDDGATWSVIAVFLSEHIFSKQIFRSDLTVHYFIDRNETTEAVTSFYWGGGPDSAFSGVNGFRFKEATNADWQAYYLGEGNFTGFIIAPYVAVLGNTFYGIILLGFCMGLYLRYRSLSPVVLFIILIAGTLVAGGVNIVFGEYVIGLIWAACAFGIALVYWRVFR